MDSSTLPPIAPPSRTAFAAGTLERALGRAPHRWTANDLADHFAREGMRLVSLLHVGGDGALKTLDFAPATREHLLDVLAAGERADGSSLFPDAGIRANASDVLLRPRIASAFVDPFSPAPTLAMLCGHAGRDGAPLPESPDTILRAAAARFERETGFALHALGEVEYFVGRPRQEQDARGASDGGYHATAPFVAGEGLRREALAALASLGVRTKYAHSEVGYVEGEDDGVVWEQHEIELGLSPLAEAAEAVALTRWVLGHLARRHGQRIRFDPVLQRGHAGTGLHFHVAAFANGTPQPVRRGDGTLSEPAEWLVAGLLELGAALMAFGNRDEGSFVRLGQAREAPNAIVWGEYDRSALIRLPFVPADADGRAVAAPTVEFRLPDGSAHAHLLLAGLAQAALAGRDDDERAARLARAAASSPGVRTGGATPVPRTFAEVGEALAHHRSALLAGGVFPHTLLDRTITRLGG
jgi:glutamine synthetase